VRKEGSQVERRLNFLLPLQLDIRLSRSYLKEALASKGHTHLRGMKQNNMLHILEFKGKGDRSGLFDGTPIRGDSEFRQNGGTTLGSKGVVWGVEEMPQKRCVSEQCAGIDRDDQHNRKFLLALCSRRIFGFVLRLKVWGQFSLDRMTAVEYNHDAFERLVLGPQPKQDLKALVSAHITSCKQRDGVRVDDIIQSAPKGTFMVFQGKLN
jgi:hypothetical protein